MTGELTRFLEERESSYRALENLLKRAEHGGLRKFSRDELIEFGHLYRLASADLARARYVLRSPMLSEYLNEIVGRAHHLIHRKRIPILRSLRHFLVYEFPSTVRKEFAPILLAIILLGGSSIAGGLAYMVDKEWGQLVAGQPELRQYEQMIEEQPAGLATSIEDEMMPAASAFIITNNIRVSVVAAAGGILFGLGTLLALIYNGFFLGVVGVMFLSRGAEYDLYFWSGILPHGVLELPAICIAGGVGFLLARGLLIPGKLSRGDAVRMEARDAMKLLGGVIVILIIAGLIEAYVTPLRVAWIPSIILQFGKILFATALFGGLVFYLMRSGLEKEERAPSQEDFRTTTHLRLE
jgi:uncharacterized membrane protein SpoIIM required for sporulation